MNIYQIIEPSGKVYNHIYAEDINRAVWIFCTMTVKTARNRGYQIRRLVFNVKEE